MNLSSADMSPFVHGIDLYIPLPAFQQSLCLYVIFLYEEGLVHSSIKCYLSAVRHLQISRCFSDPLSVDFPQLQVLLCVVKVCHGLQGRHQPIRKLPISPNILHQLRGLCFPHHNECHYIMLWAVCCCCFFGFFHSSELMVLAFSAFDSSSHITINDIAVDDDRNPAMIQFTLKARANRWQLVRQKMTFFQ